MPNNDDVTFGIVMGGLWGCTITIIISTSIFLGQCSPEIEKQGELIGKCKGQCASENVEIKDKTCFCLREVNKYE